MGDITSSAFEFSQIFEGQLSLNKGNKSGISGISGTLLSSLNVEDNSEADGDGCNRFGDAEVLLLLICFARCLFRLFRLFLATDDGVDGVVLDVAPGTHPNDADLGMAPNSRFLLISKHSKSLVREAIIV